MSVVAATAPIGLGRIPYDYLFACDNCGRRTLTMLCGCPDPEPRIVWCTEDAGERMARRDFLARLEGCFVTVTETLAGGAFVRIDALAQMAPPVQRPQ